MPHGSRAVPHNRIAAVMEHTVKYAIEGRARLARDAGVSKSAVSRLLRRECVPSTTLMLAVTRALEKALARPLDPRELISPKGDYPTPNVCDLCGCDGCLPERAYNEDGSLRPGWEGVEPGPVVPAKGAFVIGEAMAPKQREALKGRILGLGYPAYLELVRQLLVTLGYRDVRLLRPGSIGGADLSMRYGSGVTDTYILVQAKRSGKDVNRRFVDELRGAVLRFGAGQGLVVATSGFSRAAREAARRNPIAPVRLLDGEELLDLLSVFRIGVRRDVWGRLVPDGRYFLALRKRHPGKGRRGPGKKAFRAFWEKEEDEPFPRAMMFRSHALVAVNSLWLLRAVPSGITSDNAGILAALAVFGAMLPDLDSRRSAIRSLSVGGVRPFQPLGFAAHRYLGHRGLLHSAWGLVLAALLGIAVGALTNWQAGFALWLGYASHLAADACTKTGIPFLPGRGKAHLLPQRLRLSTGSAAEDALLPLLAAFALLLLLSSMYAG